MANLVERLTKMTGPAWQDSAGPLRSDDFEGQGDGGDRRFAFVDRRHKSRGYGAPPWPSDFDVRLGRLEDLSGSLLEDFASDAGLPQDRVGHWRTKKQPTEEEIRAMLDWAQSVPGGLAVLLTDCSNPWPIKA